jgi:hypothetical protein
MSGRGSDALVTEKDPPIPVKVAMSSKSSALCRSPSAPIDFSVTASTENGRSHEKNADATRCGTAGSPTPVLIHFDTESRPVKKRATFPVGCESFLPFQKDFPAGIDRIPCPSGAGNHSKSLNHRCNALSESPRLEAIRKESLPNSLRTGNKPRVPYSAASCAPGAGS